VYQGSGGGVAKIDKKLKIKDKNYGKN